MEKSNENKNITLFDKLSRYLLFRVLKKVFIYGLILYLIKFVIFHTVILKIFPWLAYEPAYTKSMDIVNLDLCSGKTIFQNTSKGLTSSFIPDPDGKGTHIKFKIPKAYLTEKSQWKGDKVDIINIDTTYPEFLPVLSSANKSLKASELGTKITSIELKLGIPKVMKEVMESSKNRMDKHYSNEFNLELYRLKGDLRSDGSREPVSAYDTDYYFSKPNVNPAIRLKCASFAYNENVLCRVNTFINNNIEIEYTFLRKNFHKWTEINENVNKFILSLIEKNENHR